MADRGGPTDCLGLRACANAPLIPTDRGTICGSCGKDRPAINRRRPRRRAARLVPVARKVLDLPDGYVQRPPTGRSSITGLQLVPEPAAAAPEPPALISMPCATCGGEVGRARYLDGHRECTSCKPLQIVAIGLNKAAPDLRLAADVDPETVASGRRRP